MLNDWCTNPPTTKQDSAHNENFKLGMVTRTFSQSIQEAEAGGSLEIELQSEFQNSKGYIKNPYLKKREAVKKRKMQDSRPYPHSHPHVYMYVHAWLGVRFMALCMG